MRRYYYLISSLKELFPDQLERPMTTGDFMNFCYRLLNYEDYKNLCKLYIFNDIKNMLKKTGDPFIVPAYYEEGEFIGDFEQSDKCLPFLKRYLYNRKNNIRKYQNLSEADEITAYFYEDLPDLNNLFLKNYYSFELDLRNFITFISHKKNGQDYKYKLIPFGTAYESITENKINGQELSFKFPYLTKLQEIFESQDFAGIERGVNAIRWEWLDTYNRCELFSLDTVMLYSLKLQMLNRWKNLEVDRGKKLFEDLVGIIRRSIKFSIEFSTMGEKR